MSEDEKLYKKKGKPATGKKYPATFTISVSNEMKVILNFAHPRKVNKLINSLFIEYFKNNQHLLSGLEGNEVVRKYILQNISNEQNKNSTTNS